MLWSKARRAPVPLLPCQVELVFVLLPQLPLVVPQRSLFNLQPAQDKLLLDPGILCHRLSEGWIEIVHQRRGNSSDCQ